MQRLIEYLFLVIGLAIAVQLVCAVIVPLVPYAIGGLVVVGAFYALYYRKGRW